MALEAGMFWGFVLCLNNTFPARHTDQPFLSFSTENLLFFIAQTRRINERRPTRCFVIWTIYLLSLTDQEKMEETRGS